MRNRKGKLPPIQTAALLVMRLVDTSKPTRAVIATENPCRRFDETTQQIVNEVLLMDGVEFRNGKDQIPIVDTHDDSTVRNILGSIQHMQIDHATGELIGQPIFASDDDAQTISKRMNEGHITDFSITGLPLESLFVPRGHSYTTKRGAVIEGPAIIHVRWQPQNASLCATGADEQSTVRRSYEIDKQKGKEVTRTMDETLLAQLASMGMPEGMTDPNQILAWVVGKMGSGTPAAASTEAVESMTGTEDETQLLDEVQKMEAEVKPVVTEEDKPVEKTSTAARQEASTALVKRALVADQKRRTEIQAACTLGKVERAFADELCDAFIPLSEARKKIMERMVTNQLGTSVNNETQADKIKMTAAADDKFYAAVRDGLILRAFKSASIKRAAFTAETPAAQGSADFQRHGLLRLAMAFMTRAGAPVERMVNRDIAMAAMGDRQTLGRYRIERSEAYHTTGSFANLLLDASNKTLLAAYEEAPYTWSMWARQAASTEDLKPINRMRFGESPDLEEVPELHEYKEGAISDSKESYKVAKYGKLFSVSWETVVNDDLDAISRVPAMHGNAARRLQNKKVYEVLTSNPTMGDGNALFSSSHASGDNTSGAAAAPSVTTLNAAFVKMMLQKGLTTDAILGLSPRYLIVPVNYGATVLELLGSMARPEVGGSAAGNSNTLNIYGPNGSRTLTPIIEPQLDASSSTVWYAAADAAQIDTIELAFLSGEESPVIESEWDFTCDAYKYKVRQTFGVKAIDWRGVFRNA